MEDQITIIVVVETKEEDITAVEVESEMNMKEEVIVVVTVEAEVEEGEEEITILTNAKTLFLKQVNINIRNDVHFHVNTKVEYRT